MPLFEETIKAKLLKLKELLKARLDSHEPSFDENGDEIDCNVSTLGLCMLIDAILEKDEEKEKLVFGIFTN